MKARGKGPCLPPKARSGFSPVPTARANATFIKDATGPGGPIEGLPILNPDWLTKELLQEAGYEDYASVPEEVYKRCFIQAAREMERAASEKLRARQTVCVETVLSTPKYLSLIDAADEVKASFNFVYIVLRSPELACERVAHRVKHGGHPVPADKIVARYRRSLNNLPSFAARAAHFRVYDNSDSKEGEMPRLIAEGKEGKLLEFDPDCIPEVLELLLPLALLE